MPFTSYQSWDTPLIRAAGLALAEQALGEPVARRRWLDGYLDDTFGICDPYRCDEFADGAEWVRRLLTAGLPEPAGLDNVTARQAAHTLGPFGQPAAVWSVDTTPGE